MTGKARDLYRSFLKDTVRKQIDFSTTDQALGKPEPAIEKPFPASAERIALPPIQDSHSACPSDLYAAMKKRRSRRKFSAQPLSLAELSFLLWATQGVRDARRLPFFRTVPSAGARHPLETYLAVHRVTGLAAGLYRYLPLENELLLVRRQEDIGANLAKAAFGQAFIADAAVTFIWTAVPYRTEWRYAEASYKVIAIDVGHVCQNLYLAAEGMGAGTCAIGAYDQEKLDALLGVDGEDEFAIYFAPVGQL
jgi:SagB-type dehydrogenase family enzyme